MLTRFSPVRDMVTPRCHRRDPRLSDPHDVRASRPGGADINTNDRASTTACPEESQNDSTSTGLATAAYPELAAAPRAAVITPTDRGHDQAPRSWSQRC